MKLNRTREEWARLHAECEWPITTHRAMSDLATLFAEVDRLTAQLADLDQAWLNAEGKIEDLRAQLAEREGWVLVPNEPTEAMCNAVSASPSLRFAASAIYAAMIAASPRFHAAEGK